MAEDLLKISANSACPDLKELLLKHANEEYNNGNLQSSVYYQVIALCLVFDMRYRMYWPEESRSLESYVLNDEEKEILEKNELLQYSKKYLEEHRRTQQKEFVKPKTVDLLQYAATPCEGIKKMQQLCSQLPKEWTILQLCKEDLNETTFSTFATIQKHSAPIYFALLRHCRSDVYPEPICIRLSHPNQDKLFQEFANMTDYFKRYTAFSGDNNNSEDKKNFWRGMSTLEEYITLSIKELHDFIRPWKFLFSGSLRLNKETLKQQKKMFAMVDAFADEHCWEPRERVLLSLCALQRHLIEDSDLKLISEELAYNSKQEAALNDFLAKLKPWAHKLMISCNPCLAIIDERLDHFFWERIIPQQEFCRISSLNILLRLYDNYKERIENGYMIANIGNGSSIVNPDSNLPNMEDRMKAFYSYWVPHWTCTYQDVPTVDDLKKAFTQADCFVYCGHGSGLQYINGKQIVQLRINCVVFLFGCDSVRLRSHGLYSEMTASFLFYHAALCPAVVGTIHPGLDFHMDYISTYILSQWIASKTPYTLAWDRINKEIWKKKFIISPKDEEPYSSNDRNIGSLAQILCRIHEKTEWKNYNTVGYVYRGLPVWNRNVQKPPN